MAKTKKIHIPLDERTVRGLRAGDMVLLSGEIYTARDQAHKRIHDLMERGRKIPVRISGQVIYYCGPTPAGGNVIGSCGPTTSSRMDSFTPRLLKAGLKGMIGKGRRSQDVVDTIKKTGAVYFVAPAGCGAYLSRRVSKSEVVAFPELGPEAIYRLTVEDFPVIVAIDARGGNIYQERR